MVEINSPDDARADVVAKIDEYLAWGVTLVLVADPERRRMDAYDVSGAQTDLVDRFTTELFADLSLPLAEMFAELNIPPE